MKYFLNTIYLYLAHGINLIFPILIYPFLINKISLEGFGLVVLIQVIMNYGATLVDYGYNLIGTSDISNATSHKEVNFIVSKALTTKTTLLMLSLLIIPISAWFVKPLEGEWQMIFFGWLYVFGIGFYPVWYFQGKEKMQLISIINLTSKLICIIGILVFISGPADLKLTVFLLSFSSVLCAILSLIYIYLKDKVRFLRPSKVDIIRDFKLGFSILSSNILVQVYSNFVLVISTGILSGIEIGILGVFLKIRDIFMSVIGPIQQAVYPDLSRLINNNLVQKTTVLMKKTLLILFSISLISIIGYYILIDFLNEFLFKNQARTSDMLVFLCIFLVAPYGGLITKILVAKRQNKFVFFSTFFSGLLALIISQAMVSEFLLKGALYVIFISYLLNVVIGCYFVKKTI